MKNKIKIVLPCFFIVLFIILVPLTKKINLDEIIDTDINYSYISINDKLIISDNHDGILTQEEIDGMRAMDYLTFNLSFYTVKPYHGKLPKDSLYTIVMKHNDGSTITILDNKYLSVEDTNYSIIGDRLIDLNAFYTGKSY